MTRADRWRLVKLIALFAALVATILLWGPIALVLGWGLLWLREKTAPWRLRRAARRAVAKAAAEALRVDALVFGPAPVVLRAGRLERQP
jgi:hypothetical protein